MLSRLQETPRMQNDHFAAFGQQQFEEFHLQLGSLSPELDSGGRSASGSGGGFVSLGRLVGVETGMAHVLRRTGVGREDGRPALNCNGLYVPVEGVRGPAELF